MTSLSRSLSLSVLLLHFLLQGIILSLRLAFVSLLQLWKRGCLLRWSLKFFCPGHSRVAYANGPLLVKALFSPSWDIASAFMRSDRKEFSGDECLSAEERLYSGEKLLCTRPEILPLRGLATLPDQGPD